MVYVTAVKRYEKDGSRCIVYLISNLNMVARNHVSHYSKRWAIEKFFRTAKQSLGLTDCQSRKKNLQENPIYNVFFAYAILQFNRKKSKLKNPEKALDKLKRKKDTPFDVHLKLAGEIFGGTESIAA